jgi:CheY-like chemotaxis protein
MGSEFTVSIPFECADDEESLQLENENIKAIKQQSAFRESTQTVRLNPLKILAVDDDPVNRVVIRKFLEKINCEVILVENGIKAVDIAKKEDFDLIFMDIQMPELNGIEASRMIRHDIERHKTTPIVALTAYTSKDDKDKILSQNIDMYLAKPVELESIIEVLNTLCR